MVLIICDRKRTVFPEKNFVKPKFSIPPNAKKCIGSIRCEIQKKEDH